MLQPVWFRSEIPTQTATLRGSFGMLVCCGLRHDSHATVGATSTLTYSRYHHCSARVPFAEAAKFKTTQAEACATKKFAARRENPALRRIVVHFNFLNGVKNF